MKKHPMSVARQIAVAASAFAEQCSGRLPTSLSVVLGEDTLVVALHGALSPAEQAVVKEPAGAAQVQEFHRQLFAAASAPLRQEILRITGVAVREAAAEVETSGVVKVFPTGTVVQVFLLAGSVAADTWSGSKPTDA